MIVQWTQGANAQLQVGLYPVWTWVTGDAGEAPEPVAPPELQTAGGAPGSRRRQPKPFTGRGLVADSPRGEPHQPTSGAPTDGSTVTPLRDSDQQAEIRERLKALEGRRRAAEEAQDREALLSYLEQEQQLRAELDALEAAAVEFLKRRRRALVEGWMRMKGL